MSNLPPPPPPPPQGRGQQPGQQPPEQGPGRRAGGWPRWTIPVLLAVLVGTLVLNQVWPNNDGENLSYTEMMDAV
ncbi:MAG TPA: hypothetical protein VL916_14525, partial [Ilumatobacteraceae bacterium]|nr:hypothetical protein [Ilumatobacteraceae bacterium]